VLEKSQYSDMFYDPDKPDLEDDELTPGQRKLALSNMQDIFKTNDSKNFQRILHGTSPTSPKNDTKTVRYQKVKNIIRLKNLLQEEESSRYSVCSGTNDDDEMDDYAAGDVLEALEQALAERLFAQQKAVQNWFKIGMRIQII